MMTRVTLRLFVDVLGSMFTGVFRTSQVGQLNSRDQTLVLRDRLYSELQKDWPGYSPLDQQLLRRILVRY